MASIEARLNKIMDEYLLPAGHEFQKVQHDFQRLMQGKELYYLIEERSKPSTRLPATTSGTKFSDRFANRFYHTATTSRRSIRSCGPRCCGRWTTPESPRRGPS
jgi:hypothetical protein